MSTPTLPPIDRVVVDDATRREFIALLAAAGLLAGCGSDDPAPPATSAAATATWSRGPFGPVEVPRSPQRIVVGNAIDADFALALGLPVVGAPGAIGNADSPFAEYHADRLADATRVQSGGEPNYEQIAELRPDLILDSWDTEQSRYDLFSGIAPTVNFAPVLYPDDFARTDWPAAIEALGDVFGRATEAEQAVEAYADAVAAARADLSGVQGLTFAGVNGYGADGAGVIDAGQQVSQVAADLGLTPHSLVSTTSSDRVVLSLEELSRLADADVIFLAVYPAADSLSRDTAFLDPTTSSPLWRRLPAVDQGRVIEYPGEVYYASPLTALAMADVLRDGLAGVTR
jgi:iron complex transport system substrate-binding protein